jgi:type VI protein secretion system component VasK
MISNSSLLATDLAPWAEYGLSGLVIAALFGLVIFLLKGHRAERLEWNNDAKEREAARDRQGDEFIKVQAKMTEAIKELTGSQRESLKLHREIYEDHIRSKAIHDLSKG